MRKVVRIKVTCSIALVLSGCINYPATPREADDGKYYMMGDNRCRYYEMIAENTVQCFDEDQHKTGVRYAMTDQQLQMWQFKQRQALLKEQLRLQQQQYHVPKRKQIDCYRMGLYTHCETY